MRCTVAVALHRPYRLPEDPLYMPVQAGAALREGFGVPGDDTGDHISRRNPGYSELTVHYWLWKNRDADVFGLCHYRRYFAARRPGPKKGRILGKRDVQRLLETADVIVPVPRVYLIETNYTQYIHAHHAADLDTARQVIADRCPAYLEAYDLVMKRRWGRRFNMFIMRREPFCRYSAWLFDILFELERRLDTAGYTERDLRVFGYVAERLMDVWLEKEQLRMRQLPVLCLESQHWPRKILTFLGRRFLPEEKRHIRRK